MAPLSLRLLDSNYLQSAVGDGLPGFGASVTAHVGLQSGEPLEGFAEALAQASEKPEFSNPGMAMPFLEPLPKSPKDQKLRTVPEKSRTGGLSWVENDGTNPKAKGKPHADANPQDAAAQAADAAEIPRSVRAVAENPETAAAGGSPAAADAEMALAVAGAEKERGRHLSEAKERNSNGKEHAMAMLVSLRRLASGWDSKKNAWKTARRIKAWKAAQAAGSKGGAKRPR